MSFESIGRRWARAVFEIGKEAGQLGPLSQELSRFAEAYQGSDELRAVLGNPLVPHGEQEAVLVEVATRTGVSDTGKATLRLLAQKRRIGAIVEIARQLARLADEDAGLVRAEVTSAGPLSPAYLAKLTAELEKATGKKVAIVHREDKALIAGVVTKLGDQVIDGSVRARLGSFREALLRT